VFTSNRNSVHCDIFVYQFLIIHDFSAIIKDRHEIYMAHDVRVISCVRLLAIPDTDGARQKMK